MAWALVRSNSTYPSGSTTLPSNTAGHLLVVVASWGDNTTNPTLSDTAGNTWLSFPICQGNPNGNVSAALGLKIWYVISCKASASTNTFTPSPFATDMGVAVYEFSYSGTVTVESSTSLTTLPGSVSTTATPTTGSISLTGTDDLVFACFADENTSQSTVTVGSLFGTTATLGNVQTGHVDNQEYLLGISGGSGTAAWNLGNASGTWVYYIFGFTEHSISLVQSTLSGGPTSTFSGTVTAGNLIVVWLGMGSNTPGTVSVSDNKGNTYHAVGTPSGNSTLGESVQIFYAWNCLGGSGLVVTASSSTGGFFVVDIAEFSGVQNTSDPLDVSNQQNGITTGAQDGSSPVTTTKNNDLLVASYDWAQIPGTFSGLWATIPFDDTVTAWGYAGSAGSYSINVPGGNPQSWATALAAFMPVQTSAPSANFYGKFGIF